VRKTRRGPNTSAALPAVGCAIAVARYSAVTSAAVCPIGTPIPRAIGSRAVAISELLMGLRADPMNSGVVNCHGNGALAGARPHWPWRKKRRSQQIGETLNQGRRRREDLGLLVAE
jgi:hypothetical protein